MNESSSWRSSRVGKGNIERAAEGQVQGLEQSRAAPNPSRDGEMHHQRTDCQKETLRDQLEYAGEKRERKIQALGR